MGDKEKDFPFPAATPVLLSDLGEMAALGDTATGIPGGAPHPPPHADVATLLPPQPPEPPPRKMMGARDPLSDSCKDCVNDAGAIAEKPHMHQELEHGEANSSSLNSCNVNENQISCHDDMSGSESKDEKIKTEGDGSTEEKVLKKPDKVLPCPRCNSMDTKFCYYNNYNINQPRHFCRSCQRYWTAGGTMRNIPVGAGKRKSKHSTAHCRSIMIPSSCLAAPGVDASLFPTPTKGNESALKFGSDSPLHNSMASLLSIGAQKKNASVGSASCCSNGEVQEDRSCASSVAASNHVQNELPKTVISDNQSGMQRYCNGVTPLPHVPCYAGSPLVYPWSPAWNGIPAMAATTCSSEATSSSENGNAANIPWNAPSIMPLPGFCAAPVPFPVMPPSFWAFVSAWPNGTWSAPWLGPSSGISAPSSTNNNSCSDTGSPVLGKHSRDSKMQGDEKVEKSLWIPKTLRIDDPDEAAKSSIWTTLGIEPGERGMFRPFQSKPESRSPISNAAQVLQANPAALSRSESFQENT